MQSNGLGISLLGDIITKWIQKEAYFLFVIKLITREKSIEMDGAWGNVHWLELKLLSDQNRRYASTASWHTSCISCRAVNMPNQRKQTTF